MLYVILFESADQLSYCIKRRWHVFSEHRVKKPVTTHVALAGEVALEAHIVLAQSRRLHKQLVETIVAHAQTEHGGDGVAVVHRNHDRGTSGHHRRVDVEAAT